MTGGVPVDHREQQMSEDNKVVPIPPVTRRAFLQGSALVGFSAFLAACGTSGTATQAASQAASQAPSTAASVAPTDTPAPTPKPTASAELNFANWPLYIDVDANDKTKHKSLDDFTAKYGTKINYKEVINGKNLQQNVFLENGDTVMIPG